MKHFFKVFIVFFVIFTMIFGTSLYLIIAKEDKKLAQVPFPKDITTSPPPKSDERVNVLLLGVDSLNGNRKGIRTDTIMVLSIDPQNNKASILSIPRDTRVKIRGRKGYDKINAAHAYGGVDLSIKAVKDFLGIPIHHYIKVDYRALYKTVDDVGGVEVYVPMNMKYDDPYATPPLHINLKKGRQVLNGEKAMQFLRFRKGYANQDLGRIQAQQQFLDALAKKVLSPSSIFNIKDYIDTFNMYVDTDMSTREMASLVFKAKNIDLDNLEKETVPGVPMMINGIAYYKANTEKLNDLVQRFYYGGEKRNNVKIAVLNGSGKSGAASSVSEKLIDRGLKPDVVGNADDFNNPKTIIYYDEKKEEAEKIRRILGKGKLVVNKQKLKEKNVDIIVLVGKDI
ncbi:LCP family protein [Tepidibacter thalassicus]|uniref:Transcriptional attenuator, LytR family n=1 Tax=Tepidibacter thalassicus DSM 15285 TaxID=1123350 RepID=A0A1M5NGF2_9FIRM|nr:LCP family protein [Tepidibacter thalassicus]SHG88598.1 transcriptional attenuator, LytR family [Tepidibacter thalassicus DSM 15285]